MATTYRRAEDAIREQVYAVMERHHPELKGAGVTVDVLWCEATVSESSGEMIAGNLKHGGRAAWGTIRITSQKERALGRMDAEMTLCEWAWKHRLSGKRERDALIDHELTHLQIVREQGGVKLGDSLPPPKKDGCGRPRLKSRQHDVELGLFYEVADRHKAYAPEAIVVREVFATEKGQLFLAVMELGGARAVNAAAVIGRAAARVEKQKTKLGVIEGGEGRQE